MNQHRYNSLLLLLIQLFLLFHIGTAAVTTFNTTFDNNVTNMYRMNDTYSEFNLGILKTGDVVSFDFFMPNKPSNLTAFTFLYLSSSMYLYYFSPNISIQAPNPAFTSNNTPYSFPPIANWSTATISYSATYTVAFPAGSNLTSAEFGHLIMNGVAGYKFAYYTIEIKVNSNVVFKTIDVGRQSIIRFIYIDTPGNYQIQGKPAISNYSNSAFAFSIYLFSLNVNQTGTGPTLKANEYGYSNFAVLSSVQAALNPGNPNYTNNIAHYNLNLTVGYYSLWVFSYQSGSNNTIGWISYPSSKYDCPYDSYSYGDKFKTFAACVSPPRSYQNPGLPCVDYDKATGLCTSCINGYSLQGGRCMANTTCPPRQYFHFGVCTNVNSLCDGFDAFTGDCLNCSDSRIYNLINGSCIKIDVQCQARQYQLNNTCFNVSSSCNTYDPSNGRCLSCVNEGDQLLSNGSCVPIVINCPQGTYAVKLNCVTIPNECVNFNVSNGLCISCIKGYSLNAGVCKQVQCPSRQFPSADGQCVTVSDLCGDYDPISGKCLSCKDPSQTVRNGQCLSSVSALAGCMERQRLGFGPCVGADVNCQVFNLVSGDCDQCKGGFSFDYTGHCVAAPACNNQQWSVNGQCMDFPANCLKVDNLGFCIQCANSDYRIESGMCVFFKRCADRQYLNAGGQCSDVSPDCGTWNPSNGDCITCRVQTVNPVKGICCPQGQTYSLSVRRCVDAASSQNSSSVVNGAVCITMHPSLNYCLACSQGSAPDYSVPYGCS